MDLIASTIEALLLIFFVSFIISFLGTGVSFIIRKIAEYYSFNPFNIKDFSFKKEFFSLFRGCVFFLIILKIIELLLSYYLF
jgi:hypothetical protein